jgi:hypothetical protein
MKFKKGDWVTWNSQSHAYTTTKTGQVIAVIDKDTRPSDIAWALPNKIKFHPGAGTFFTRTKEKTRNHESYLIVYDGKLYWPHVKNLKLIDKYHFAYKELVEKVYLNHPEYSDSKVITTALTNMIRSKGHTIFLDPGSQYCTNNVNNICNINIKLWVAFDNE